jgi:catalase
MKPKARRLPLLLIPKESISMATSKKSPGSAPGKRTTPGASRPKAAGEKGASSAKQSMSGPVRQAAAAAAAQPGRARGHRHGRRHEQRRTPTRAYLAVRRSAAVEGRRHRGDGRVDPVQREQARRVTPLGGEPAAGARGRASAPKNNDATGSTITESNESGLKIGAMAAPGTKPQQRPAGEAPRRFRRALDHHQPGRAGADNQNSLKAGLRGPTLLEDFILREKITHFDHERIPERVVHARGSARTATSSARGITDSPRRALRRVGKRTPVFVRFSTVAGERGSPTPARDVRGFAVKFYTDEGNWDLVGNNIPVFFIQDAMKFPDLVHA